MITRASVAGFALFTTLAGAGHAGQAPPVIGMERFDVKAVQAVRPALEDAVTALKERDVGWAKEAFEAHVSGWNDIKIYINARSKDIGDALELDYQVRLTEGLRAPTPNVAALLSDAQQMLAKYDEAINLVKKTAPLNRLYDEVARLQIVRASLREVPALLNVRKLHEARDSFTAFDAVWDGIEDLIKERSLDAYAAIDQGLVDIARALTSEDPDVAQTTALVSGVLDRYNAVVAEITKEARSRP